MADEKELEYLTNYEVANDNVTLTVTIGNGHLGLVALQLGDELVEGSPFSKQPLKLELGNGTTLADKTLIVSTTVATTNDHTKSTIVTYDLSGGAQPISYAHEDSGSDRDINAPVRYRAEVTFKAKP